MRRRAWLLAAVILFGLAAWLMSRNDEGKAKPKQPEVEFPRYLRQEEHVRLRKRRTLPPPPQQPVAPGEPEAPPATARDPLLTALPAPTPGETSVVLEANALRHSPLGQVFLDCVVRERERRELDEFRERFGIDPLEDVDRLAFSDGALIVTGHFRGAQWDALLENQPGRRYGEKATIWEQPAEQGGGAFAAWNGELVVLGDSLAEVELSIDRLEGRVERAEPSFPEQSTYGDAYGFVSPQQLAELLGPDQRELAERLRGAAEKIELHADASGDLALVADVDGPAGQQVEDLGKALGAALSLARLQAKAQGEDELVELLDFARVKPGGGRFSVELALPLEVVKKHLCRDRDATTAAGEPGTPPAPPATP